MPSPDRPTKSISRRNYGDVYLRLSSSWRRRRLKINRKFELWRVLFIGFRMFFSGGFGDDLPAEGFGKRAVLPVGVAGFDTGVGVVTEGGGGTPRVPNGK